MTKRLKQSQHVAKDELKERGYEDSLAASGDLAIWRNFKTGVSLLVTPIAMGIYIVRDRFKSNQQEGSERE